MKVQSHIADTPEAAMAKFLEKHMPLTIAEILHVNNGHIYQFRSDGHVSPTLRKALIRRGFVPAPLKRYRLHYECGRGDEGAEKRAQLEAEMDAAGVESFSDYVDILRKRANEL